MDPTLPVGLEHMVKVPELWDGPDKRVSVSWLVMLLPQHHIVSSDLRAHV